MASTAVRRIQKDLADLNKTPIDDITITPKEEDVMDWDIVLKGPVKSPYKGGIFKLNVKFSPEYPFKAPTFTYKTRIYHPNIDSDGNICISLLKTENWKPATKIPIVILAIYDLLERPNPDDPLVTSIADQYRNDPKEFEKTAKEYTAKYAI